MGIFEIAINRSILLLGMTYIKVYELFENKVKE